MKTFYLITLKNLCFMLRHRVRIGHSIAYVNTWESSPPPAEFLQHKILIPKQLFSQSNSNLTSPSECRRVYCLPLRIEQQTSPPYALLELMLSRSRRSVQKLSLAINEFLLTLKPAIRNKTKMLISVDQNSLQKVNCVSFFDRWYIYQHEIFLL